MTTQKLHPEGLLGKKLGMTQIFAEDGSCVPVTVIQTGPCVVVGLKSEDKDGYQALQLGFKEKKNQRMNKAELGRFRKAGKGGFYHVAEVRCDAERLGWNNLGKELTVSDVFEQDEKVDVSGLSIGRGFAGVMRRFDVKGQPKTRGTHEFRRHIGSVGCRKFPGRIWKNQKMPGRMGGKQVTIQNLKVVGIRPEENLLLVKGAIPGAKGSFVIVRRSMKGYVPKEPVSEETTEEKAA